MHIRAPHRWGGLTEEELRRELEAAKARAREIEQQIAPLDLAEADFIEDGDAPAPEPEFVEMTEADERHLEGAQVNGNGEKPRVRVKASGGESLGAPFVVVWTQKNNHVD